MKRSQVAIVLGIAGVLTASRVPADIGEPHLLAGVELGGVGVLAPLSAYTTTGGTLSPWAAYMLNNLVGVMGGLEIIGLPNIDRPGVLDDDATWVFGAKIGPRIDLPIGDLDVWGTFQPGVFTGLAPNSAITDTSWGFSTGGGATLPITHHIRIGGFCRYNRLYQRVHGDGDARYVTAGAYFEYNFSEPPPAPTKEVAKAAAAPTPAPTPAPVAKKIVLRGVNFDFDKSNIRADARPILDEAIKTLKAEGTINIVCEGHTDDIGTEAYNLALSRRRAVAVKDYLVAGGIAADRITTEGLGESKPVASNATADGRAQNRRVELRIKGN